MEVCGSLIFVFFLYIPTLELKKMTPTTIPNPPVPHKTMVVHGAWHAVLRQHHASPLHLQQCAPPSPKWCCSFAIALRERCVGCLATGLCHCSLRGRVLSETGPIEWTLLLQDPRYRYREGQETCIPLSMS
jgi:hypothetical protein